MSYSNGCTLRLEHSRKFGVAIGGQSVVAVPESSL